MLKCLTEENQEDLMTSPPPVVGIIEVIVGGMFAGKTEEMLRRLRRAKYAQQNVYLCKPSKDTRYSEDHVESHDRNRIPADLVVSTAQEILDNLPEDAQVVGIDEGQFWDDELFNVAQILANRGIRVIITGLDMDYKRQPFRRMTRLVMCAEVVTKLTAICATCGNPAGFSERIAGGTATEEVGAEKQYAAKCRRHHVIRTEEELGG